MRETFVMYTSYDEKTKFLNDEEMGKLIRCIFEYEKKDDISYKETIIDSLKDSPAVCTAFMFIADDLDRLNEKYKAKSKNGKLGGRPKSNKDGENLTKPSENLKKANESKHKADETLYVNVNDNVNVNVNDNVNTSGDEEKEIITLVLKTGDEFSVSEEQFKEWQRLYPSVDVLQELRKMKGWCDSNPKKRKSESGIKRFITGWLAREQSEKKETDTGLPEWYGETTQMPNDPELEKEIEQMMKEVGGIEI